MITKNNEMTKFAEYVKETVTDYLPEEYSDAKIVVETVEKLNGSYTGLSIRLPGQNITPTINIRQLYERYESGEEMEELMNELAMAVQQKPGFSFDADMLTDYEKARERLFIRLTSAERVRPGIPAVHIEDLAMTYHILVDRNEEAVSSVTMTDDILNSFGITKEKLHWDALRNSQKLFPAQISSVMDILREMMIAEMGPEMAEIAADQMGMNDQIPLTCVTNSSQTNGAAVLFYPGMLDQIAEKLGGSFYILPSSIHESLVVPDTGDISADALQDMVKEVNMSEVAPEDKLTDSVYHYDPKQCLFKKIS